MTVPLTRRPLGRKDFTEQIVTFDASTLCAAPLLLDYLKTEFIGREAVAVNTAVPEDVNMAVPVEEAPADAAGSAPASPVRGPGAAAAASGDPPPKAGLAAAVLFGRRAAGDRGATAHRVLSSHRASPGTTARPRMNVHVRWVAVVSKDRGTRVDTAVAAASV